MALIGWIFATRRVKMKVFFIPYYLLFMNLSVITRLLQVYQKKTDSHMGKGQKTGQPVKKGVIHNLIIRYGQKKSSIIWIFGKNTYFYRRISSHPFQFL